MTIKPDDIMKAAQSAIADYEAKPPTDKRGFRPKRSTVYYNQFMPAMEVMAKSGMPASHSAEALVKAGVVPEECLSGLKCFYSRKRKAIERLADQIAAKKILKEREAILAQECELPQLRGLMEEHKIEEAEVIAVLRNLGEIKASTKSLSNVDKQCIAGAVAQFSVIKLEVLNLRKSM